MAGSLQVLQVSGFPNLCRYHWRELPQISFLLRQKFSRDKYVFVATKYVFCCCFFVFLSRQKYACRDKTFVATKFYLSQQIRVCRDKHTFSCEKRRVLSLQTRVKKIVATNICRNKHVFVATTVLSRQAYFCRDKGRVLSRQKQYLWQLPPMICRHQCPHAHSDITVTLTD